MIVLSLDGTAPGMLDAAPLPALARMAREGARAEALVPPFPSSTFASHVTLATGTHPDRHGIVANRFLDAERGRFDYDDSASWLRAEPLWAAAERQGVRSAVYFWVGSSDAYEGRAPSLRVLPFDDEVPETEKVAQILSWLDRPPAERPRLVMSYWRGADSAGHRHGPDAEATLAQLAGQDAALALLLEGLDARDAWAHTTLIVVSDHGMVLADEPIDAREPLREAGIEADVFPGGGYAHVYLEQPGRAREAAAALAAIPGVEAWPAAAVPPALRVVHPGRSGHVVAVTAPPRFFAPVSLLARIRARVASGRGGLGVHGYPPERSPAMHGILLAMGRGVDAGGRPGRVHAIDLAPTVALLLEIAPPADSEGRAIAGIGAE